MSSLRTAAQRSSCLSATPKFSSTHTLATSAVLQCKKPPIEQRRIIHNISLPVHSEDTVYTRSAHAFSRAQAESQIKIAELRRVVEKRDAVIEQREKEIKEVECVVKHRDAMIRDLQLELVQKKGVIRQLEMIAQGVRNQDGTVVGRVTAVDKQGITSGKRSMEGRTSEAGKKMDSRVKYADTMMALIKEMRDSRREAYDPL